MSDLKKPRADSKLKTLPEERQAAIADYAREKTLKETRAWLKADGLETSEAALSGFLSWWALQQQLKQNENTVAQVLENLKQSDPNLSVAQLEQAGQMFFSALAIQTQDSLTWKRIQDSKLKLGALELSRQKFQRDTVELFIKWAADKQAMELATSNAPTADKTEKLGQKIFGALWE